MDSLLIIVHGNIVIPTGNPLSTIPRTANTTDPSTSCTVANNDQSSNVLQLGKGIEIRINHIVAVNIAGIITHIEPAEQFFTQFPQHDVEQHGGYIRLNKNDDESTNNDDDDSTANTNTRKESFLCPGAIDLHIHAPQYAFTGTGTDKPLMGPSGWLETYTFPTESNLRDLHLANSVYEKVVQRTLRYGTTTALYYATLDLEPTKVLVDMALKYGQRALVGKVCMDRNAPSTYCQSVDQNLIEIRALVTYIRDHPLQPTTTVSGPSTVDDHMKQKVCPLVLPVITPRFIPTCTPSLLDGLAKIAREYDCHITSHISESLDEVSYSRDLAREDYCRTSGRGSSDDDGDSNIVSSSSHALPSNNDVDWTDAKILHSHGLLTNKCVMAHGVYLSETDLDLMKACGAAVAHCPLSNFYFAGSSLPCKRLLQRGNKVGLGTDIAGGYHPSILDSAKAAVIASLSLQHQQNRDKEARAATSEQCNGVESSDDHEDESNTKEEDEQDYNDDDDPTIDFKTSFYLATLGGAEALGMDHIIGTFRVGMEFDAIVLTSSSSFLPDFFPSDSLADKFQKLWILGDDRNISHVFVQGRRVI